MYISQVRSLTLDSLKPSILRHLKAVGNVKSNSVYEALLPPDFDRSRLKNEENRLEFITEKYVIMKYASPEDKERILLKSEQNIATVNMILPFPSTFNGSTVKPPNKEHTWGPSLLSFVERLSSFGMECIYKGTFRLS